jgi:hypothetical protein
VRGLLDRDHGLVKHKRLSRADSQNANLPDRYGAALMPAD